MGQIKTGLSQVSDGTSLSNLLSTFLYDSRLIPIKIKYKSVFSKFVCLLTYIYIVDIFPKTYVESL